MSELITRTPDLGPEHWFWQRNPESYTNPMAPMFTAPYCEIYPRCDMKHSLRTLEESGLLPHLKLA